VPLRDELLLLLAIVICPDALQMSKPSVKFLEAILFLLWKYLVGLRRKVKKWGGWGSGGRVVASSAEQSAYR
jgi:hypothetical protein